jgi:hypothetical protein
MNICTSIVHKTLEPLNETLPNVNAAILVSSSSRGNLRNTSASLLVHQTLKK